ncbi:MAG: ribosome maturation factor RimM, partial [Methylophilales bacterium 16-45-9]
VKNLQGVDFGTITDVFETGANDVIEVRSDELVQDADKPNAKPKPLERLLPFIATVVLEVDLIAKTMLVDWDPDF